MQWYSVATMNQEHDSSTEGDSLGKCNLTFAFNFDLKDVNSRDTSDSETDLQIDVSEVDKYDLTKKDNNKKMDETSALNEMVEEIERQLDAKAAKSNLTVTNVKNILKHVITNEHVMAMVQKRLKDTDEDIVFEPKLTRAKAKELAASQLNIPWPITPVKKASSEVKVLIEEELPEDSSDEEYNPEHDKHSDDDREVEFSAGSDVDSQPSTPANLADERISSGKEAEVQYDLDGVFKIPSIPHVPTEEENIGQRTRSKLCLSETPLEMLEQSFMPPDITTDMYDWDCELDEDWDNFLKEFTKPLPQDPLLEDDPDADPEYNILEDEESDLLDKEELRADKAVKVTRKELNNLIAELFEFDDVITEETESVVQELPKKKRSSENNSSVWTENNSMNYTMIDLLPALAEPELPRHINYEQRQLLKVQLEQHIQFLAQHFVMMHMHPKLHSQAKICKDNLNSLKYLSTGPESAFNGKNLLDALKLVADWESKFLDNNFSEKYKKTIEDEEVMNKIYHKNKYKFTPKFPPGIEEILSNSNALIYPQLLPEIPFYTNYKTVKRSYLNSEDNLIALGLEQFLPLVQMTQTKFKKKEIYLMDAVKLTNQYLLPCKELKAIFNHVKKCRQSKSPNPIKYFFEHGSAPRTVHVITLEQELKAPKDQPLELLSLKWQNFVKGLRGVPKNVDALNHQYSLKPYDCTKKIINQKDNKSRSLLPVCHPLRNPIINMLPKIITTDINVGNIVNRNSKNSEAGVNNNESNSANGNNTSKADSNENQNTFDTHPIGLKNNEIPMELPQLRKRTPRLAKLRSAENMKQFSTSKSISQVNNIKSKTKNATAKKSEKTDDVGTVDNEDEIAELMLASTTIKKDSISRKKAKQARELENIKRLLEAENLLNKEERESKFAASYLQKLHSMLESNNPEVFRAVIKTYLDHNEKLDIIMQEENGLSLTDSENSKETLQKIIDEKDILTVNLYHSVCDILRDYPDLCSEFLLFLKPHQAAMVDKSVEYAMLQKMTEFFHVAQVYFAKQPSRLAKIMQAITQLASDRYVTLNTVHAVMGPVLKGHPLVMDLFLQVLPEGKPPECLFASHLFENLTCPLGPHDKNKIYSEDASELYENIELPTLTPQDDPYGGENCKCSCHKKSDENTKPNTDHCVSCGTRFLNGRIYLQTPEGLRPAKITFPGEEIEKQENIARVSLKLAEKFIPVVPTGRRRKSSKSYCEEGNSKPGSSKNSPTKDSDEAEKSKMKRGTKSPPKSDPKRSVKRLKTIDEVTGSSKRVCITQIKKRDKKSEKKESKSDERNDNENVSQEDIRQSKPNEENGVDKNTDEKIKYVEEPANSTNTPFNLGEKNNENSNCSKTEIINTAPWTRQEDLILLQNIKKEYSENSFINISKILGDRTVTQVKDRCQILLNLMKKMT